jgi:hypothetical protein
MAKKKQVEEEKPQEKPEEPSDGSIAVNDAWTGMLAISLLFLVVGTGFLAWDYMQYNDEKLPTVPKLTGTPPGGPPKADAPKDLPPKEAEKKEPEKKDPEKKEG